MPLQFPPALVYIEGIMLQYYMYKEKENESYQLLIWGLNKFTWAEAGFCF